MDLGGIAEPARLTKPMGRIVLLLRTRADQPREVLIEQLGLHPHLLVEWKQLLRDAGAVRVVVQVWGDSGATT